MSFIDVSALVYMINRRNQAFADEDILKIADAYHKWKREGKNYEGIKGFCKSDTWSKRITEFRLRRKWER